jgi:hypothetical protein
VLYNNFSTISGLQPWGEVQNISVVAGSFPGSFDRMTVLTRKKRVKRMKRELGESEPRILRLAPHYTKELSALRQKKQ